MSPEEREAIKARCDAATPGPWGVWEDHAEIWAGLKTNTPGMVSGDGPLGRFESEDYDDEDEHAIHNAVFAAAARTDVPALLAEVERLEAERDRVIEQCRSDHADWTKMAIAEWSQTYDALRAERDAAQRALAEMTTQRDAYRETNASIALQRESPEMASQLVVAQRALAAAQAREAVLREALTRVGSGYFAVENILAQPADDSALQRALAAAQADSARLRAALRAVDEQLDTQPSFFIVNAIRLVQTALAASAGDDALREFGLRVAKETARAVTRLQRTGTEQSHEATVDAVLRGER